MFYGIGGVGDVSADDDDVAFVFAENLIHGAIPLAERIFAGFEFDAGRKVDELGTGREFF